MEDTRFAFTLAKPTPESIMKLHTLHDVKFLFYSKELTPKSELYHIQGYLELKYPANPYRLKHVLGGAFYIEPARKDRETNCRYCAKCGNPFIIKVDDDDEKFNLKSYVYENTLEILDNMIKNL